ncbi:TlpA disulfide reductase family protein [Intestinimonas butyriciproducens]|uniref:TlpA disulfide reductase family protein n=1 Tax=Intestinimonas butyriciproducens TaxID=1297617 RepID=UPI0034A270E1
MNKKNFAGRLPALLLIVLLVLSLAACGAKDNDKQADMSGDGSAMTGEPKTAEEALALHKELLERENALLSENAELWEKVFMEADKGMAMIEDGKNYGDFLLDTVEAAKEQFTDKEYEWLKESATEISNIENKLTELEEKYPEIMQKSMDGDMSVPGGSDMTMPPDDGSMQKFPAFEGKDLDGNTVKSDELFASNAVTVVNFWFTTCNPCVGELSELDALNKELAKKGGALIGVNTFTLDGDETAISEAKDVLAKKGATYQNVYFDSDGEAGKFTTNIFAYPTTYVVDRNGNIVGDPIVGAITEKKQAETLQAQIDKALAADMG